MGELYVYDVESDDGCYYPVGGKNRTKALISFMHHIGEKESEFIHYRARLARDYDGKKIPASQEGVLGMEELMSKGYRIWWDCPECGKENCFEYVKIDRYKCKECGHIEDIPFVD